MGISLKKRIDFELTGSYYNLPFNARLVVGRVVDGVVGRVVNRVVAGVVARVVARVVG